MEKTKLEKAKEVIRNNFHHGLYGIYNTHRIYDDEMTTIYHNDELQLTIYICYEWEYFEVFGLLQGDFEQLENYYYNELRCK